MTTQPRTRTITLTTIAAPVRALFLALCGAAVTAAPNAPAASVVARVCSHGGTVAAVQGVIGVSADGVYGSSRQGGCCVPTGQQTASDRRRQHVHRTRIWTVWIRMPATGRDISWPQCPKGVGRGYRLPMPPTSARLS